VPGWKAGQWQQWHPDMSRNIGDFHTPPEAKLLAGWLLAGLPDVDGLVVAIRRGFVAEVTCPQQAWLEHGPALVRAHPVERVTLGDRSPETDPETGLLGWVRFEPGADPVGPFRLDHRLWDKLPTQNVNVVGRRGDSRWWRLYPEGDRGAFDGLSAACLAWAKGASRA
jgi:hypothetical protein